MNVVRICTLLLLLIVPCFSAIFTVANVDDSGDHSLRWALEQANTHIGADSIVFNIPDSSPGFNGKVWVIAPLSPLPTITDGGLWLNAATQRNTNSQGPEIFIDGRQCVGLSSGLVISSAGNIVQTLGITSFSDNGILITDPVSRHNIIYGCFIGVAQDGKSGAANGGNGIYLKNAGPKNRLGGNKDGERNIISANLKNGIQIEKADSTIIQGNLIGCDAGGNKLPNQQNGIFLYSSAQATVIGGDTVADGNVVSANLWHGILIQGTLVKKSVISQNHIGVNQDGTIAMGNERYGLYLFGGAVDNQIGPFNMIVYNQKYGIGIAGSAALRNVITQNAISQNTNTAVQLSSGANAGVLPPVILQVTSAGVQGKAPAGSVVEIYSDPADEAAWFEAAVITDQTGDFIWNGQPRGPNVTAMMTDSKNNSSEFCQPLRIVPFVVTTTRDSVEGSLRWAITGSNLTSHGDKILFDIPTTDPGYDAAQSIWVIKPTKPLPVLSAGQLEIDGTSQSKNRAIDNPLGPEIFLDGSAAGDKAKGIEIHSSHNWIHDIGIGSFSQNAIAVIGEVSRFNRITGCYVGLAGDGVSAMPQNGWSGIVIATADSNTIGGATPLLRNHIVAMGLHGILLSGAPCRANVVQNNFVGVNTQGRAVANVRDGIRLEKGPSQNLIGGLYETEGNICSGNGRTGIRLEGVGVDSNQVAGNRVGVNIADDDSLANAESGIVLADHAQYNLIGGADANYGNVVSGNRYSGMQLRGNSDYNTLCNNTIGLNSKRNKIISNTQHGIFIYGAAANNDIGPANVIAGNGRNRVEIGCGIVVDGAGSKGNKIFNNRIGSVGNEIYANTGHGVYLLNSAMENKVGPQNVIAGNVGHGVCLTGEHTVYNTITSNAIYDNGGLGIDNQLGANLDLAAPIFAPRGDGTVYGRTAPYARVELFSDATGQGRRYLGSVLADALGEFSLTIGVQDTQLTATATDVLGNTSEFSRNNPTFVCDGRDAAQPLVFQLQQNYPNPFNAATLISFTLPQPETVSLSVYNIAGQRVALIKSGLLAAGAHQVNWIARDESGADLPSGAYYYVLKAGAFLSKKKMVLLR